MTLAEAIAQQELWLRVWIYWMVVVNLAGVAFAYRHVEARWVVAAFLVNGVFMSWLHSVVGYTRLLGLSHVIFWTPLLVYLFRRLPAHEAPSPFGIYVRAVMATNGISLVVDYVDVGRYLIGERSSLL